MKNLFQLLSMVLFVVTTAQTLPPSGANATENYVYSRTYLEAVTSSNATAKQVQSISYFDGLGRPKQNIGIKATPQGRDIVTPIVYDGFGRQTREYLPIPQNNTTNGAIYSQNSGLVNYPVTDPTNIYSGEKIYAEKNLENSPLDRVLQQYQVGNDWSSKPIAFDYLVNNANEVKKYTVTSTWSNGATNSTIVESGFYPQAQLYKNTVTDEDGNVSIEFKNGQGQTLLVRKVLNATQNADTYYVYNEWNQLAFVISPLASASALTSSSIDNLCYQYRYDNQNRLVEKKLPGKGWEYMVYDKQDRLVATQDANMRASNQWLYTKYDQFGRVAFTGMFTGGTRVAEQTAADNAMANNVQRSSTVGFIKNGLSVYYTAGAYPTLGAGGSILSVNYYDTYPADMVVALPTTIQGQNTLSATPSNNRSTKGLPTASYVKNIEDDNWTRNYTFYDTKARAIGTYSQNHLGGYTRTETVLDFAGVPQNTFTYHKRVSSDTEKQIKERFVYDSQNRLMQHYHQVNTNAEELLANNTYNELSQLNTKKVGGNVSTPLQTVDYKYNIRGWMTQINDLTNLGTDLFGYKMNYNILDSRFSGTAKYNGNISQIAWITNYSNSDKLLRNYSYSYDGLNRLIAANYLAQGSTSTSEQDYYNENLSYDLNGNIKTLQRFSKPSIGITAQLIDQLNYTYSYNRLMRVSDTSGNYLGYPTSGSNYTYDANGNMTSQIDKGISGIQYNYLNLPKAIAGNPGSTNYNYRTDGSKLRKLYQYPQVLADGTFTIVQKTTDYLDGFQYENNVLQFVPTSEGYFDFTKNAYIYNYVDHLGNVRLSYYKNSAGVLTVLEENNYYPFGLKHTGYNILAGNQAYKYRFNGKEYQSETGFTDFGARMYMDDLGRWGVVDPLNSITLDSYGYANNNPIFFNDPTGMIGDPCDTCPGGKNNPKQIENVQLVHINKKGIVVNKTADFSFNMPTNCLPCYSSQNLKIDLGTLTKSVELPRQIPNGSAMMLSGDILGISDIVGILLSKMEAQNRYAMMSISLLAIIATKGKALDDAVKAEVTTEKIEATTALAPYYPLNRGALGNWTETTLEVGTKIDRFGSNFGKYFSPKGTPINMRALPPGNNGAYNMFEVIKSFNVQSSTIAPWFGKPGLGTQYYSPFLNANELIKGGFIKPVP